jgi:aminoglycoside phosphotransferase (APT) family kinase protein
MPDMTDPGWEPHELIGRGRAADIYALDGGRVLRRYRTAHRCESEAGLMRHLRQAGYPVPEVFGADGRDLVMERLAGPTMLDDLARRPWRVTRHARLLADLHNRLHQVAAPAGLRHPVGPGDRVVHLDLHPGNVMLTPAGPVVIDWSNGGAGAPGADVAMTFLIMASSDADELPPRIRPLAAVLRRIFLRRFLAAVGDDHRPYLAPVADIRIADPNVRPAEATRLRRLARDVSGPR